MIVALVLAFAFAEPERAALEWSAPAGCPTQADVAALLEREGVPPERRADVQTRAVVTETDDGQWRVAIAITQASGELRRELELDSCTAAAEAVALVYALALTESGEPEPEAEPEPVVPKVVVPKVAVESRKTTPTPTPRVEPTIVEPRASDRPRRAAPRLTLHAGGGGGVGTLGRGGGHVLAGLGVAWQWIRIGVRIDHAIVRQFRRDGVGANVSATTGGVELSIPIATGPVELLPTVDLRAGAVRARGTGGVDPRTTSVPWILFGAGLSLAWMPGDWWGFRVGAEVEVPFLRHTFVFDTLTTARTQRVGGLFWAGPEFRFPRRPRAARRDSTRAR